MKNLLLILFSLFLSSSLYAQELIYWGNPSFEAKPRMGELDDPGLKGWTSCNPPEETGMDIHPSPDPDRPFFGVDTRPFHGKTYIGMVARDNGSWESVCQRLSRPLKRGKVYQFSIYLCQSDKLVSFSRRTMREVLFDKPIVLRVYGSSVECGSEQLLAETEAVDHTEWLRYIIDFEATENWNYITLEAFYKTPVMYEYNGNILLDNCSPIVEVDSLGAPFVSTFDEATKDGLALPKVKEMCKNCAENNISTFDNGEPLKHVSFLNNIIRFNENIDAVGLQKFVVSTPFNELTLAIRSYENLGAKETVKVIKELTRIYLKNKNDERLTEKESSFFENGDALFREALEKESINTLMEEYVDRNLKELEEELEFCY